MRKLTRYERSKFRVKIKSLAEEARIIRKEEKRYPGDHTYRGCLRFHRIVAVRHEARHTLLAYAILRGVPYKAVEPKASSAPCAKDIRRIVDSLTYIHRGEPLEVGEWIAGRWNKAA